MRWVVLLSFLMATAPAVAKPIYKEVLRTDTTMTGQPIEQITDPEVRVTYYEIPAGETFPIHKHPHQRSLYLIEGEIDIIYVDLKKKFHFKAGEFLIETRNEWHYGKNNGTVPVRMVVIDVVPKDSGNNVLLK